MIHEEGRRGLALDPVLLNELRARTGILLAAIGASTAFFGAAALKDEPICTLGVLALVAFAGAVGLCLWVVELAQ